mmetsp:Transcript_27814/g.34551  ORF Transcript_27814/g.34551 Transcript_27814/m.34551 type:complete len:85 (+) Transcript_27814:3-257(+)
MPTGTGFFGGQGQGPFSQAQQRQPMSHGFGTQGPSMAEPMNFGVGSSQAMYGPMMSPMMQEEAPLDLGLTSQAMKDPTFDVVQP